jgi:hypothetical protein
MNYYSKSHTVNVWTKIIIDKFNEIGFNEREKHIATILSITSKAEIAKIKQASFNAFGKSLGIESFEDACVKLGVSNDSPKIIGIGDKLANKFIAEYKLTIIIKALNNGWYPNWTDATEYKYWSWFDLSEGFSYCYASYFSSDTSVPSALLLKSRELVLYCGEKFLPLYKVYML